MEEKNNGSNRKFQSTLPARGATSTISAFMTYADNFNPRSPHGERPVLRGDTRCLIYFNPRSPHGERRVIRSAPSGSAAFQSTLPARGATLLRRRRVSHRELFQSTLPARGATFTVKSQDIKTKFQSTLPARGATVETQNVVDVTFISIHAPRTGSDV